MKRVIFLIFVFLPFIFVSKEAFAKKRIGSKKSSEISGGITVSPRLRSDRKALIINFSNLQKTTSFTYELTYLGSGVDQGVYGSVKPQQENSTVRELLFGTCSRNICRYHANIQNMRLVVTANLKNGRKVIYRYLVKP